MECFDLFIKLLELLATIVIAITAVFALGQWKKEIRGTNKYKALIKIKVDFLNFKNLYHDLRLSYIRQIKEIPCEQFDKFKKLYGGYFDRLWNCYDELNASINYYRILCVKEDNFLDSQLSQVYKLIRDYITSVDLYLEHKSKKIELDHATLDKCEKYVLKSGEEDEISVQVSRLIKNTFDMINSKLG